MVLIIKLVGEVSQLLVMVNQREGELVCLAVRPGAWLRTGATDEARTHQPCVPDTQALPEPRFLTCPCQVRFLPEHGAEIGN